MRYLLKGISTSFKLKMTTTTTTQSQITRVRVSPCCEYDTQADRFFDQRLNLLQSIEEMLIEYLGVKIIKSVWAYYANDPYAHPKCAPARSQYVFVDIELLPNTNPMIECSRAQVFDGHLLSKLKDQYISVYIQDTSINVLSGSFKNNIVAEDVEFMGLQEEDEEKEDQEDEVQEDEDEEKEDQEDEVQEEEKVTIRVRVAPNAEYDTQEDRFFDQRLNLIQSIEEMLIEHLGVKIIKSVWVYYNTDPYAHVKCEPARSQYVFVDFEWLPNTDQMTEYQRTMLYNRHLLLQLQDQYTTVFIQEKCINVRKDAIRTNIVAEDTEFMGLPGYQEEKEEDQSQEDDQAQEEVQEEEKVTIRVRVCPIYNDGLTQTERYFQDYSSVLKLHQQYVEELLIAQFGVKIIKSIDVYYTNDPYFHTGERSQYVFVDFEWLPKALGNVDKYRLRRQLLTRFVIMEFQERFHLRIDIQDKKRNVLMNSTSSMLNYHSNSVPITAEFIEECLVDNEPFTGEHQEGDEEEPSLGYRDAYVNFV